MLASKNSQCVSSRMDENLLEAILKTTALATPLRCAAVYHPYVRPCTRRRLATGRLVLPGLATF